MKYLVFGDVHGRDLGKLRERIGQEGPDVLVCTGDFDQVEQVRQFNELREDFDARTLAVGGNHDDAVLNGLAISSGTLREQGETVRELHNRLVNHGEARETVEELVETRKQEFGLETGSGKLRGLLIHGALAGDLSSFPGCPEEKRLFWRRLLDSRDHRANFRAMEENGYDLMVRGHDHEPEYAFSTGNGVETRTPGPGESFSLEPGRSYTLTHGAWYDGWFMILENGEVTYRRI